MLWRTGAICHTSQAETRQEEIMIDMKSSHWEVAGISDVLTHVSCGANVALTTLKQKCTKITYKNIQKGNMKCRHVPTLYW